MSRTNKRERTGPNGKPRLFCSTHPCFVRAFRVSLYTEVDIIRRDHRARLTPRGNTEMPKVAGYHSTPKRRRQKRESLAPTNASVFCSYTRGLSAHRQHQRRRGGGGMKKTRLKNEKEERNIRRDMYKLDIALDSRKPPLAPVNISHSSPVTRL